MKNLEDTTESVPEIFVNIPEAEGWSFYHIRMYVKPENLGYYQWKKRQEYYKI